MFFNKENREKKRLGKMLSEFVDLSLAHSSYVTNNEVKIIIWYIIGASLETYKSLNIDKDTLYNITKEYLLRIGFEKKVVLITLNAFKAENIKEIELKYLESGSHNYKNWIDNKTAIKSDELLDNMLRLDRYDENIDSESERSREMIQRSVDLLIKYGKKKN